MDAVTAGDDMNFDLPEEIRMLKDTVRKFVDRELIPIERTARDGHFGIEDLPWEEVVDARGYLVKIQTNTTCRGLKSRKVAHHG